MFYWFDLKEVYCPFNDAYAFLKEKTEQMGILTFSPLFMCLSICALNNKGDVSGTCSTIWSP